MVVLGVFGFTFLRTVFLLTKAYMQRVFGKQRKMHKFSVAFSGAWCTDIRGNFTHAETANANTKLINDKKTDDVIDLRLEPEKDKHAAHAAWHLHRILNGRIISHEQAGYLRAAGGSIGVDDWDSRSYGKRMVPVYTKWHVRCMHVQNPGEVVTCEVYGLIQKLPLFNIVEAKVVWSIDKAASLLQRRTSAENAHKRRRPPEDVGAGRVLDTIAAKGMLSLEAFLEAYYAETREEKVNTVVLATMLATAMRSGVLMHVSSNEGGDRFKDKRGVQALADEYDEAIQRFITA
jgi:hypothetical protein